MNHYFCSYLMQRENVNCKGQGQKLNKNTWRTRYQVCVHLRSERCRGYPIVFVMCMKTLINSCIKFIQLKQHLKHCHKKQVSLAIEYMKSKMNCLKRVRVDAGVHVFMLPCSYIELRVWRCRTHHSDMPRTSGTYRNTWTDGFGCRHTMLAEYHHCQHLKIWIPYKRRSKFFIVLFYYM